MNSGKYVFSQLVDFLPKRVFDMIVKRYEGDKWVKTFTCWNQLLVMMYGQLAACDSLREVTCIVDSIKNKSYHLGFGTGEIKLSNLSYANLNRDYKIFEEFAYYMINLAQSKRIDRRWMRFLMSRMLSTSLTKDIMTLRGCIQSTLSAPTLSSDRSLTSSMRLLMVKSFWKERITSCLIKRYALLAIRPRRNIPAY